MRTYTMTRLDGKVRVFVDAHPLPLRLDLVNHSPDGFNWGYLGSGPAQLAFALVYDALGCEEDMARLCYQKFKAAVLCAEDRDVWCLTDEWIQGWVSAYLHYRERKGW